MLHVLFPGQNGAYLIIRKTRLLRFTFSGTLSLQRKTFRWTCFGWLWRRDSSSSILFLHGIWWSFVRILTSKPRIWTNRLGFKFKKGCYLRESLIHSRWVSSAIYWTPKFHRDSSSANRYLIASLQLLIRASLCCICFFWWILRGAEIGGEGVYIRW